MKLNLKTVLMGLSLAICLIAWPSTKAFADGPPYLEMEPNNSISAANQIVLYDAVNAALPKGDIDYYKIYIPTSDMYELWFNSPGGNKTINISLSDTNNNTIFTGTPDENNLVQTSLKLGGLYNLEIRDDSNVDNQNGYSFEFYPNDWQTNNIYRFAGIDRYETSFNIFKNNWTTCSTAVITTGDEFPDALSAAPLAKKYNAPIILTKQDSLSSNVENQLEKSGVKNVFIIGGVGAISNEIETKLSSMGITCTRLAGEDRYSTNLAILKQLNPKGEIAVATGENFPDALSIAPIAASSEMPILLVNTDSISDAATNYIKENKIINSYIIGGTGVVSKNCEDILSKLTVVKRLSGVDRYETNIAVLNHFQDTLKLSELYFATGKNYPDALSGSVLAAAGNHPVVLIDKAAGISTTKYALKCSPIGICVFGGEGVVPSSVIDDIYK